MQRSKKIISLAITILLSLSCGVPGIASPDADVMETATESLVATNTFTLTPAPTFTPTFTPTLIHPTARFPSETPTNTLPAGTATSTPGPTTTFTPIYVEMSVSRPTNCRTGPGKEYDVVGSLAVGVTVPVIGRDGTSQYWYIPNPYVFTDYCWVWGGYATFNGPQFLVPAISDPPTPIATGTPAPEILFKLKKQSKYSCDGRHWINIGITNKGLIALESIEIIMQDKTKNITRIIAYDDFPRVTDCGKMTLMTSIAAPDGTGSASGPKFDYNFQDNTMFATVKICSKDALQGVCATQTILLSP